MQSNNFRRHTAIAVLLTFVVSCEAEPLPQSSKKLAEDSTMKDLPMQLHKPDPETANYFQSRLLASSELQEFEKRLSQEWPEMVLDRNAVYTMATVGERIGVYIPIQGGAGYSAFSVWYSKSTGQKITTFSTINTLTPNKNIRVRMGLEGKPLLDAVLTPDGHVVNGIAFDGAGKPISVDDGTTDGYPGFTVCMVACVVAIAPALAVVAWLLRAIIIACAIACEGASPPVCVGCIAAGGLVGGGVVWGCYDMCKGNLDS